MRKVWYNYNSLNKVKEVCFKRPGWESVMYQVVVWGTRTEYDYFRKWFEVEILKNSITINAIVFNEKNLFKSIDGIPVVGVEELPFIHCDYIIDMNQNARQQILRLIELFKIPNEKIIPARIFGQPFFDLERWLQVRSREISIISSHCWGGYVYNTLGLEFKSPFINMFLDNDDFFKVLGDIYKYMQFPLIFDREEYETNLNRKYPVIKLNDATIHFNHYTDFNEAVDIWNRRKERINYDNLFIEMTAKNYEDIERFQELPYENKICFTMLSCDEENVISIKNPYYRRMYEDNEWQFAIATAMKSYTESKQYDLLKLLNQEKDYFRAENWME